MIHVISPFGEGVKGVAIALTRSSVYVIGSVVGGTLTTWTLALLGQWILPDRSVSTTWVVVGSLGVLVAARDVWLLPVPLPQRRWQVPRSWMGLFGPYLSSGLYGVFLGAGWMTYAPFGCYHVLLVLITMSGLPELSVIIGAVYGLVRALPVPLAGVADRWFGTSLAQLVDGILAQALRFRSWSGMVLAAASTWLLCAGLF